MSTTPPRRSSPLVELGQAPLLVHPSVQVLQTPKRPTRSVPSLTPCSRGSGARTKQEGNTDREDRYKRDEYEEYVREDLKSRVFVDFEVFMKSVLHVPDAWKSRWGSMIKAVKDNSEFRELLKMYRKVCDTPGPHETDFYKPLMEIANKVLDLLSECEFDTHSGIDQRYHVNDPKVLRGGVLNKVGLIPDLVVLHEGRKPGGKPGLHWANPLHILEVKPYDNALCEGTDTARLVVDGIDPIFNHAKPHRPLRYKPKAPSPSTTSGDDSESVVLTSGKRPAEGSHQAGEPPTKKPKTASRLVKSPREEDKESSSMATTEPQVQVNPAMQVCRYLLEMLSIPLLRSHATVGLVDRDRLQLYHANRSVILVSSAINFSGAPDEDGLDKFIAVIIAFRCLSPEQNGILNTLVDGNIELTKNAKVPNNKKAVQEGKQLKLPTSGLEADKFTMTLGEVISRDPAIIGRSTVVLKAKSDQSDWGENLVIKVSYPGSNRIAENEFLWKANEDAKKTEGRWATKHLPNVLYSEDIIPSENSTLELVARLLKNPTFADAVKGPVYEPRTLRIIIQEELHPLKSLTNTRDIGQAFLDIACIHRWLYDKPGILHRDLSLRNIMCRIVKEINAEGQQEEKVYGVLTDYDLSSWTKDLKDDYTRTSQQRTGTPPYMAQELLKGTSASHLYRHDVESLFYIMLLMCGRHDIVDVKDEVTKKAVTRRVAMRQGLLPYEDWFNEPNYERLGKMKREFLMDDQATIYLTESFVDFRKWLTEIHFCFGEGFTLKRSSGSHRERPNWIPVENTKPTPFDDETLGNRVGYSTMINSIPSLKGELEGLIVRYNPSPKCEFEGLNPLQ